MLANKQTGHSIMAFSAGFAVSMVVLALSGLALGSERLLVIAAVGIIVASSLAVIALRKMR
jgi:hydrogenase/urease accessory protein HupE